MSRFNEGSFNAEDFKKEFDLSSVAEDKAYSEGSTTGTKQTSALGTYLTEDDFNRNRNSDATWEAYASVYGQDKADAKREGNEDGLSINAFDALMDRLSAKEKAEAYKEQNPKVKQSATLSKAKAGVKAYNEKILPNFGDYLFGKPGQAQKDYLDAYTFNLRNEVKDKEIVGDLGIDLNAGPEEKQMEEEQAVMGVGEVSRFD